MHSSQNYCDTYIASYPFSDKDKREGVDAIKKPNPNPHPNPNPNPNPNRNPVFLS